MWTDAGRQFQEVGTYGKSGLSLKQDIFPNYKYGFNGRHFSVSTNYVSWFKYLLLIQDSVIKNSFKTKK